MPQDRSRARAEPSARSQVQPSARSRVEPAATAPERSRPWADPDGISAAEAARCAARQVAEFTGRDPEAVVAIERTDRGWRIGVEVVESRRIPDSADILAIYEAELD
ncbi:MAG: gas vesicle protein GvpO, partial [Pseudonocardiaceae bacterium]